MSVKSIAVLKTYFERRDKPTQAQFADLLDTLQDVKTKAESALALAGAQTSYVTASPTIKGIAKIDRSAADPVVATTDYVDEAVADVVIPDVNTATDVQEGVARIDRPMPNPIVATTLYVDESISTALSNLDVWVLQSDDGENYPVTLVTEDDGTVTFSVSQIPTTAAPLPTDFSLRSDDGNRYVVGLTTNLSTGVVTLKVGQTPI